MEPKSNMSLSNDLDLDSMNIDSRESDQTNDPLYSQIEDEDKMHVDSPQPQSSEIQQPHQQQQQQDNGNMPQPLHQTHHEETQTSQVQNQNQNQNQNHNSQYNSQQNNQNSQNNQNTQNPQNTQDNQDSNITVPIDIKWVQGGEKVYVTGSFTGWKKMIGLVKQVDDNYMITLGLPVGTHRFRFVVDNELRFSDFLPTATDQLGNFVNYIEITPENVENFYNDQQHKKEEEATKSQSRKSSISRSRTDSMWGLINDDDDMGNGYSRYHDDEDNDTETNKKPQYINDIPPIFTDPKVMEQYYVAIDKQSRNSNGQQQAWLHPPHLPPHLDNVILNNFNNTENNSGALPIPNHVVLNHLATTSIKHNTLAVASIVRYKRKYVTQVLYAPLQQST